jgi:potassium efflux system protein
MRGLFVAQRQLALKQAKEKREARMAAAAAATAAGKESEPPPPVESPSIDLASISDQTRKLIRTGIMVVSIVSLYLIWADVLPALRILDEVKLWSHSLVDGKPQYITLANVLAALLIAVFTVVAARNVPGLLEITILERTPLDSGGRYAFSTISRYVITGVGVVLAFQAIGVGWSSVQWLVAAVSVGLGFGLQEIFANFVSGIIILFERPVRVGDIVTVGDTSGTVARVRIRATTIVNFDRKELIVPNKELITGRIINWTLSDTVTRIEIRVGVAYGSDTQLVQKLMLGS